MPDTAVDRTASLDPKKFRDPDVTATGEERASVSLVRLQTLWFNTGSLCNITCRNCYIESSPRNDRLAYLTTDEVRSYLDEVERDGWLVREVGFTGGEPFLNRDFCRILGETLGRGYRTLVLTNAMKPMQRHRQALLSMAAAHGEALTLRVSIDHFRPEAHEEVRGPATWAPMLTGLRWLASNGFRITVAGRTLWDEPEAVMRAGFAALFAAEGIAVDAEDPAALTLFPEMDPVADVPEITTRCWTIVGKQPEQMMCATSRMVLKRKGAEGPVVVPCTLLPYDAAFELGRTLADSKTTVRLNHPFCAQFCVLGGASCTPGSR